MALNINQILNKEGWTGEELGRLDIAVLMQAYGKTLKGKDGKPLITPDQLQRMVNTIDNPKEGRIYNEYVGLHNWIARQAPQIELSKMSIQTALNTLMQALSNAKMAEEHNDYMRSLPAIFTAKQYKDIKEKQIEEQIHPDGKEIAYSVFSLIEVGTDYYLNELQKHPRKKNPLKPLKEKYQAELVKDEYILSQYNEVVGNGYYTLEDGTRSDQVELEEWQKRLSPYLEDEELIKRDEDTGLPKVALERIIKRASRIYDGMTEAEADKAQDKEEIEAGLKNKATWHYYKEIPEDLNKWEILESQCLNEYYSSISEEVDTEEEIRQLEAFREEFPELANIILTDLNEFIDGLSKLTSEEIVKAGYSVNLSELYKEDLYGFKNTIEADTSILDGNYRALTNGIAILRESDLVKHSSCIDENGYYKEPEIRKEDLLHSLSLYGFSRMSDTYIANAESLEKNKHMLQYHFKVCNNFNTAIDLVAKVYKVPEIKILKVDFNFYSFKINCYNDILRLIYLKVYNIPTNTAKNQKEKELKLEVLKDVFPTIEPELYTTPKETKRELNKLLKTGKAFNEEYNSFIQLIYRVGREG